MSNTSLVSCPFYQEERSSLFECLYMYNQFKIPIVKMPTRDKFLTLFDLSTENAQLQKITAKYLFDCFEIRTLKLHDC